ncbi:MAG: metal ABC transporter ATP-binding protein [Verrucomicrobiota bacterium]
MQAANDNRLLSLRNVAAGYPGRVVLGDVNVHLERGCFAALIGPNGSGKTTLLKTILGILKPLSGDVMFHAKDGKTPVIGYVPQRESLDPIYLLSAFEVVMMGTYGRVKPGRFVSDTERQWVQECIQATGATDFSERRFSELSGGQKQRVLIARALVTRPDLLVLDEPTAGIDAGAAKAIGDLLQKLHRDGLTILMVNHELQTVRGLVQHVIWLQHGCVSEGPVAELLSPAKIEEILEIKFG